MPQSSAGRPAGKPLPLRRLRQIHGSRAGSIATRGGTGEAGRAPSGPCSRSLRRERRTGLHLAGEGLVSAWRFAVALVDAPPGACRLTRTWDLCGLTHPSCLVDWRGQKWCKFEGFRDLAPAVKGADPTGRTCGGQAQEALLAGDGSGFSRRAGSRLGDDLQRVAAAAPGGEPGRAGGRAYTRSGSGFAAVGERGEHLPGG
jgi:hypothetical protein